MVIFWKRYFILFGVVMQFALQGMAQTWEPIGNYISNSSYRNNVYCLTNDTANNILYAGGNFLTVNAISGIDTVHNIASWNGSTWAALGSGLSDTVFDIARYNGALYAGGDFKKAGTLAIPKLAKWDGSSWSALGTGISGGGVCLINALAVYNGELYAGGVFTGAGGTPVHNIAKWNGTAWADAGGGTNGRVRTLCVWNGKLYAGGDFSLAGGTAVNYIAAWDGSSWTAVGPGVNNVVYKIAGASGSLFAGGKFTKTGATTVNYIAAWNGSIWSALGGGMNGSVLSLTVNAGILYAGGVFLQAGSVSASYVASWNGAWMKMEDGMDSYVRALAYYGGKLCAGGNFNNAGGNTTGITARWNPLAPHSFFGYTHSTFCHGNCSTFTDSSTNNPTSWQWYFSGGTPPSSTLQNPGVVCFLKPGKFTVLLTTANSSGQDLQTSSYIIHVLPDIALPSAPGVGMCLGTGVAIQAYDAGTQYQGRCLWAPNTWISNDTVPIPTFNPPSSMYYYVTVVDSGYCSASDSVQIVVYNYPVPKVNISDTAICAGKVIQLKASDSLSTTGISYIWTPSAGLNCNGCQTVNANPSHTTEYKVNVRHTYYGPSAACSKNDSIHITVYPVPVLTPLTAATICPGGNYTFFASGGKTYLWTPSTGLDDPSAYNPTATPEATTTYTVQVTDTNGCSSKESVKLTVNCDLTFYKGFAPGVAGSSDGWIIDGIDVFPVNQISVFNQWGSLVWAASNYDNAGTVWKGNNQGGAPLVAGTYYYVLTTSSQTYKGWVELFR
jgi:gliding motility-associated-like protein